MPFPLFTALSKGLTLRGYTLFELSTNPNLRKEAEKYIFEHITQGDFNPSIARIFLWIKSLRLINIWSLMNKLEKL